MGQQPFGLVLLLSPNRLLSNDFGLSVGFDHLNVGTRSLWVARSLMHRGLTFSDHPINPEYSQRVWEQAIQEIPNWPGFQRLKLSSEDQKYYAEMLEKKQFE